MLQLSLVLGFVNETFNLAYHCQCFQIGRLCCACMEAILFPYFVVVVVVALQAPVHLGSDILRDSFLH